MTIPEADAAFRAAKQGHISRRSFATKNESFGIWPRRSQTISLGILPAPIFRSVWGVAWHPRIETAEKIAQILAYLETCMGEKFARAKPGFLIPCFARCTFGLFHTNNFSGNHARSSSPV